MKEVLVVAHDAGGAEVVSAWVKKNPHLKYYFNVGGPAINIFTRKLPSFYNASQAEIDSLYPAIDTLLMGTSWKSNFERTHLKKAKKIGIKTIAFLDHWVNYNVRFETEDEVNLPDEIWVGDYAAYQIAKAQFNDSKIKLISNPYFEEIQERAFEITPLNKNPKEIKILYLCEPIAPSYGYTEFYAFENYLESLLKDDKGIKYEIKLRLHPSENINKYQSSIDKFNQKLNIIQSTESDIVSDCLGVDWVVGCETISLVIGLKLGKKVFSCIPAHGKPCSLPYPEIIDLFKQEKSPIDIIGIKSEILAKE